MHLVCVIISYHIYAISPLLGELFFLLPSKTYVYPGIGHVNTSQPPQSPSQSLVPASPSSSIDAASLVPNPYASGNNPATIIHVIAPPGKLGVVVDIPPQGGPSYVCEIRKTCPIRDKIRLGDKIIAVDDEDVQEMSAINVSKLLASKSKNSRRKISVLRESNGGG